MGLFDALKKTEKGETVVLKINGMHCASCSLNIDGTLEEMSGVYASNTSYAKSETKVHYDPEKINQTQIEAAIKELGYALQN